MRIVFLIYTEKNQLVHLQTEISMHMHIIRRQQPFSATCMTRRKPPFISLSLLRAGLTLREHLRGSVRSSGGCAVPLHLIPWLYSTSLLSTLLTPLLYTASLLTILFIPSLHNQSLGGTDNPSTTEAVACHCAHPLRVFIATAEKREELHGHSRVEGGASSPLRIRGQASSPQQRRGRSFKGLSEVGASVVMACLWL